MKLQPRWYQKEGFDATINYLSSNPNKHPLVAMPTGSGKSLLICMIADFVNNNWGAKVLILSHSPEILKQDHKALCNYLDTDHIGLYSAILKSRTIYDITVAGIQSIFRKPELFNEFDLVIIDECHMISSNNASMYRKFLSNVGKIYCGMTASPFRLGSGYIYGQNDSLFDDLVYDLTSMDNFNRLIDEGYLCRPRTMSTKLKLNTDSLHIKAGDFIDAEMSLLFDKDEITDAAITEIVKIGENYKKWLIFAIDIEHAHHIAEKLIQLGVPTGVVHSQMEFDRATTLSRHRSGKYKALVNVNVLTTGYDDEEIDLIVLLRPTESPVFHTQTIGRGFRISPGKDHFMVLDFAGNTARLGPVNNITIKKKHKLKDGEAGEPIVKTCPICREIHHPSVKICNCGHEFVFVTKLTDYSYDDEIVTTGARWHVVDDIDYTLQQKMHIPDTIKVKYFCGKKIFSEIWALDYKGYARQRAIAIIKNRGDIDNSDLNSSAEAFGIVDQLLIPTKILIDTKNRSPRILKYNFN